MFHLNKPKSMIEKVLVFRKKEYRNPLRTNNDTSRKFAVIFWWHKPVSKFGLMLLISLFLCGFFTSDFNHKHLTHLFPMHPLSTA